MSPQQITSLKESLTEIENHATRLWYEAEHKEEENCDADEDMSKIQTELDKIRNMFGIESPVST